MCTTPQDSTCSDCLGAPSFSQPLLLQDTLLGHFLPSYRPQFKVREKDHSSRDGRGQFRHVFVSWLGLLPLDLHTACSTDGTSRKRVRLIADNLDHYLC